MKQFKRSEASLVDVLALRKKLAINESDKVIISIGRMAEEKNMEALLYAIKSLESELDHVKTVMLETGLSESLLKRWLYPLELASMSALLVLLSGTRSTITTI